MKKFLKIMVPILIFIIIVIIVLVVYNKFSKINDKMLYNIVYYDDSENNIYVYNNRVEILKKSFCNYVDCESTDSSKSIYNYSKININKLKKFINSNFKTNDNNIIKISEFELNDYQQEVMQGLLLGEYFFEISVEEYKYKLEYWENKNLSYVIYFKEDQTILVKKLKINDNYNITKIDNYNINFSKKNLRTLNNYVKQESKKENSNTIFKNSTLRKDELNIIKSIIENKKSYLKNIDNDPKLSYIISYHGVKCLTPTLYLYNDNTYEYYYTFSTNYEKLIPIVGKYNYDIKQIISNINESLDGYYQIKDSKGKIYIVEGSNLKLQEFFKILNINMEQCLVQQ